jgi:aspartyl/asparaginyl beta-hydroxylase (cupin superfamily)
MRHFDKFIYSDLLEDNFERFIEDFYLMYDAIEDMEIILPLKQGQDPVYREKRLWRAHIVYALERKNQWSDKAKKVKHIRELVNSLPQNTLLAAWFSALLPQGQINWHKDAQSNPRYIRVQLPLIISEEGDRGGVYVDRETQKETPIIWQKGKVSFLDPEDMHTVWNKTNQVRLAINFNFNDDCFI